MGIPPPLVCSCHAVNLYDRGSKHTRGASRMNKYPARAELSATGLTGHDFLNYNVDNTITHAAVRQKANWSSHYRNSRSNRNSISISTGVTDHFRYLCSNVSLLSTTTSRIERTGRHYGPADLASPLRDVSFGLFPPYMGQWVSAEWFSFYHGLRVARLGIYLVCRRSEWEDRRYICLGGRRSGE